MAAPSGQTGRKSEKYYAVLASVFAHPAVVNFAALEGAAKLVIAANELKEVVDATPLAAEANPIRWTPFGAETSRSIAGVPELQDFTATVALDASDTLHAALQDGAIGTGYALAKHFKKGAGEQIAYARGELASRSDETPEGSPRSMAVTFTLIQDWKYYNKV